MLVQDFRQKDNDLVINTVTGDFDLCDSDSQHVMDILQSNQGWYKEFPLVGANMNVLLKGKFGIQKVEGTIKQQLESDGYQVGRPQIISTGTQFTIKPNAIRVRF